MLKSILTEFWPFRQSQFGDFYVFSIFFAVAFVLKGCLRDVHWSMTGIICILKTQFLVSELNLFLVLVRASILVSLTVRETSMGDLTNTLPS